jgi:hypothetical protein
VIRAFLAFLESRGAGDVLASELGEAIAADGAEGRAALVAEGVIQSAPLATTMACDGLGCAREVREAARAREGGPRFLAVCTRSPRECETLRVHDTALAQQRVDLAALNDVLRRALRVDPPLRAPHATAGAEEPVHLGEQVHEGRVRDVFFARRPAAPALGALLAARRGHPRATLVLVPTSRGVDPEMLGAGPRAHVEIAALTERLVVRDGRIAAALALRIVKGAPAAPANDAAPKRVAREHLPRPARWNEVTLYRTEDDAEDAVGVEIGRRHAKLTAADLGLSDSRTRAPVRAFDLLKRICDGNGAFDTRPWGNKENGRKIVSELRRALGDAFGIEEPAIARYSYGTRSWKTKFRALAAPPRVVKEAERGLRAGSRRERES